MKEKKKSSLVLGILSIVLGLLSPIVGLVLGIIGLVLANSHQKESELDYKTERILNIVGIVVSVINWVAGLLLMMRCTNQDSNKKSFIFKSFFVLSSLLGSRTG